MTNNSPISDKYWRNFPPEMHGVRFDSLGVQADNAGKKLQEIAKAAKEIAIHGQQSYVEVLDSILNSLKSQKSTTNWIDGSFNGLADFFEIEKINTSERILIDFKNIDRTAHEVAKALNIPVLSAKLYVFKLKREQKGVNFLLNVEDVPNNFKRIKIKQHGRKPII